MDDAAAMRVVERARNFGGDADGIRNRQLFLPPEAIAKATMSEVFWGALPFMVPLVLLCFAIILWPDAILYLPEKLNL